VKGVLGDEHSYFDSSVIDPEMFSGSDGNRHFPFSAHFNTGRDIPG
jgi:hypothetical protein